MMLTHAFMFKSYNKYLFQQFVSMIVFFLGRIFDTFDGATVCMQAKTSFGLMNSIEY